MKDKLNYTVSAKIAEGAQGLAFLILLFMAGIETDYISFYIICLITSAVLITISHKITSYFNNVTSNTKKTEL